MNKDRIRVNFNVPISYRDKWYKLAKVLGINGTQLFIKMIDNHEKIINWDNKK